MNIKPVWMGKQAVLTHDRATVFYDGIFSEPQLNHPEGIAFDGQGHVWCGGEKGEVFRIAADGTGIEQVASTGGFTLGLALDESGFLYTCDLRHSAVFRLDTRTGKLERFADGDGAERNMRIPNVPVVDETNQFLYVSDSYDSRQAGPGIWRFDLKSGTGFMWYDEPLRFANGLALSPDGKNLFVAETFARTISCIPLNDDGSAGSKQTVIEVDALPDGLTFDRLGRLYISCYEPSLIYRWSETSGLELLYYDPEAHMLCHPTNCAFRGNDLFTSNLGRWHITRIADVLKS
ncbi:SMP-30/gluconolactonase/LRE family protein [Cohnella silvisoli]|uniref:SMP-30/gluconolactonase/LRE family protein n=1 Tax=Cohnella silvisoli TaxID=2873699 RepID=A0ABV1KVU7_9BACL|nr:SMP-30/gluconolactonase/LRE family protein [Cohnella silvisoli]MCD9023630.1 SMP-30/gluconolactonase/LRE family protein [Cohnella silvisoli]